MKLILQIFFIILIVSTLCICTIKPQMHKTVIVYNSDYTIVPEEIKTVEKEEIPIMEIPAKPKQITTKIETKVYKSPVTTKTQSVKKVETKQPVKKVRTKQAEKTVTPKKTITTQENQKKEIIPVQKTSQTTPKQLTQRQEEIAWNVWRSNLQNKIMQDVYLPEIPNGTVFKFSFNVDKYGKISNVQTWSETSTYTPYAIQYIAPVIRSYQGKSILNFPLGSTRESTYVKGGWRISVNEKFSTPQDYHDVEKVVK